MVIIQKMSCKLNRIINYIYYLKSTFAKNSYPCKLLGEKINSSSSESIIVFKILGRKSQYNIQLNNIFSNISIISGFSPRDALQLGRIAFSNIINDPIESENIKKFMAIKKIMLSSTHDIFPSSHSIENKICINNALDVDVHINLLTSNNKYPFKLVSHQLDDHSGETTIIYTILGKKDGYEKSLKSIVATRECLEKFHPTEAAKFGFISAGEELFYKKFE